MRKLKRDILCTICARGGSKGVKGKNIRSFNGKPLLAHTIEQAKESKLFDHIVVSTDSDLIAEVAIRYGAEVFFKRATELAADYSGKLDVIKDAFQRSEHFYNKEFSYLVDLDVTSPLRNIEDIRNSFIQLLDNNNSNLITGAPSRRSPYFNLVEVMRDGSLALSKEMSEQVVRRQDAPKTYDMNASIYIWTRETILNSSSLFLKNTGLYVMPEERSIDIDSEFDFELVEFVKNRYEKSK